MAMSIAHTDLDIPLHYRLLVVWEAAAVLRHDLRNKLASVRNASFYLQRKIGSHASSLMAEDARIATFFELIATEIAAAEAIIAGRVPTPGPEPQPGAFDLARAVEGALGHLRPAATLSVRAGGSAMARGSLLEATIASFCVIENALESEGVSEIRINCHADAERAVLEVCDDGVGLAAEPCRVLEHFYTTKPGRLGLGVNIARRMVERSRGGLEIARNGDRGVKVVIWLPANGER